MQWRYEIDVGLKHSSNSEFDLLFGTQREELRKRFNYSVALTKGRFNSEDSYEFVVNEEKQWIRLHFEANKLFEIEVLEGQVVYDDVSIKTQADLNEALANLKAKGHHFQEWDYGFINHQVKMDIGDSEKNGGIPNRVYWILLSRNHDHITQVS